MKIEGEFVILSENVIAVTVRYDGFNYTCFILDLKNDKISDVDEYFRWQTKATITFEKWEKITFDKVKEPLENQKGFLKIVVKFMDYDDMIQAYQDEEDSYWQEEKLN
jgi:hypothetical protein